MDALQAFLQADTDIKQDVKIDRIGVSLTVKALDGKVIARLTKQATYGKELDEHKFGALAIATACTNLNFGDPKMLEKYSASDEGDCVQKALLAGEIAHLSQAVMEVSGFKDMNAQVKEAKN